jgi:hypothetical protein
MKYQAIIETKQNGKCLKEGSQYFDNKLHAEMWLGNCCKEARDLKIRIIDHYLTVKMEA